ncbi:MAG: GTPase HflX [Christensenellaceae bacterium]|jgi:GTP-binding protein HflX|nr:GTPase HflX [Christensenellaceae bacterium]
MQEDQHILKKAILVKVDSIKEDPKCFVELSRLVNTAGYEPVHKIYQRRDKPDKAFHLGKGKLAELKDAVDTFDVDLVVFDDDLSGSKLNNLENYLDIEVYDRKTLILEIFAARAISGEGKLQIDLARKKNMLPRILGKGIELSRQGGGGAGGGGARRGGGEQQLEIDRRTLRKEIEELTLKIGKLGQERQLRRAKRNKNKIKTVAIVGYTNAGKSTLMNTLTKAGVLADDKLFATLDPKTSRLWLEENREIVLTDTVGFISRLPHGLIEAFKSTLEEAKYADLLLIVSDASSESVVVEYDIVCETLISIGVEENAKRILVLNKSDKGLNSVIPNARDVIKISAKYGDGINQLKEMIAQMLFGDGMEIIECAANEKI